MKLSELIKRLSRIKKRQGDMEVRIGTYGGGSDSIDGSYYEEDNNVAIIH